MAGKLLKGMKQFGDAAAGVARAVTPELYPQQKAKAFGSVARGLGAAMKASMGKAVKQGFANVNPASPGQRINGADYATIEKSQYPQGGQANKTLAKQKMIFKSSKGNMNYK